MSTVPLNNLADDKIADIYLVLNQMFGWIQYGFEVKTRDISSKLVTFIEQVSLEQMYAKR